MTGQQLKNSILQLAIQGKLVPQNPDDEPASVLLERIRKEKEKLIRENKLKRDKNSSVIFRGTDGLFYEKTGNKQPVCIQDEIPFEIPDSWEWIRLGSLTYNHGQKKPDSEFCYIDIGSINNAKQCLNENEIIISDDGAPSRARKIVAQGDILYSTVRPYLHNVCIVDKHFSREPIASTGFAVLTCFGKYLNRFLFYYLLSPSFDLYANDSENSKGVAYPAINDKRLSNALAPVPPVTEQNRIVDKLNEVLPMVEDYGTVEKQLADYNASFPKQLKKSLLQYAMQGKLVPQNPNDEPASVLLERIREEKKKLVKNGVIKKDKHESVIYKRDNSYYEKIDGKERCIDDEIPFEIPNTWGWVRLGTVFQHNTGKALNSSNQEGEVLEYITTSNVYWDHFEVDNLKSMFFTLMEREKCTVRKGDLLVCEGGDIGRAAIWPFDYDIRVQNHIHRLRPYISISVKFYYYLFYLYKHSGLIGGKGIGIQGLSTGAIHEILFPLPPLEEQKRIVSQIEDIMPYLDDEKDYMQIEPA